MSTLVIVESPNKVSKISAILGEGYKVMASVGHVRDLPPKELGVEPHMAACGRVSARRCDLCRPNRAPQW